MRFCTRKPVRIAPRNRFELKFEPGLGMRKHRLYRQLRACAGFLFGWTRAAMPMISWAANLRVLLSVAVVV